MLIRAFFCFEFFVFGYFDFAGERGEGFRPCPFFQVEIVCAFGCIGGPCRRAFVVWFARLFIICWLFLPCWVREYSQSVFLLSCNFVVIVIVFRLMVLGFEMRRSV